MAVHHQLGPAKPTLSDKAAPVRKSRGAREDLLAPPPPRESRKAPYWLKVLIPLIFSFLAGISINHAATSAKSSGASLAVGATVAFAVTAWGVIFALDRDAGPSVAKNRENKTHLVLEFGERLSIATAGLDSKSKMSRLGSMYELVALAGESRRTRIAAAEALVQLIRAQRSLRVVKNRSDEHLSLEVQTALSILGNLQDIREGVATLRFDLSYLDLSGAHLSGLNFQGANFQGTILSKADLSEGSFEGASLAQAKLSDCLAFDTCFVGGILEDADFTGAILSGALFDRAYMVRADLSEVVAAESSFNGGVLTRAVFKSADLTDATLRDAYLVEVIFDYANLTRVDSEGSVDTGASYSQVTREIVSEQRI
ncbi:pentapeptide repeat-containing protein [Actinomadura sp. NPDC023710]|uniref:pentapeptide repeat-containing protein n=1 Tax=Actinomadura sp. NPDC023710 TaxID=3158219 RepID=UPI0033F14562